MSAEPAPFPPPGASSYDGDGIVVSYEVHRCLHAAECVRGQPDVFEVGRKSWIVPDNAPASEVADVIHRCPSGALQYHRTDGGADELPVTPTRVSAQADGVIHLHGDLLVQTPQGPRHETRVMLCGCGLTGNTPYCDHSGRCAAHD